MIFNPQINISLLLESNIHFGHKDYLCHSDMKKYIHNIKLNTSIIDLQKALIKLCKALKIFYVASMNDFKILFINTKMQTADITKETAIRCGQYYVNHRWLGGMLTNWKTISSSILKLKDYTRILNRKNSHYTKREISSIIKRKNKLEKIIYGMKDMKILPNILFVINVKTHCTVIREAKKLGIVIIGIIDTNSSFNNIDFIIPGNDDSRKSISLYCNLISETIIKAKKQTMRSVIDYEK